MNIAFYSAAAGMMAYQNKLDVTANNIANVNTTGYKSKEVSFQDLIYTDMNTKVEGEHKVGHGSKVTAVDTVFQQGVLERTDRELDFAISGKAYFAVDDGSKTRAYTRDGAFQIGLNQGTAYLTTESGDYVLDGNGARIRIPFLPGTNTPDISSIQEKIGLYTFANPFGLEDIGGNLSRATADSGVAALVPNTEQNRLISGALESSTADTATEMVHMIEAQRAFQMNARIVTSADEVEEIVNNLR